jgi:hypothetical protein
VVRTTPAPRIDVREVLPELASQATTTIRLHPRRLAEGETLPLDASKMGGDFLWPSDEPWLVCPMHGLPWVGVLQLRRADFPEVRFRPGTDLLQVLWCPQYGHGGWPEPDPVPVVIWRDAAGITRPLDQISHPRLLSPTEKGRLLALNQAIQWLSQFETFPALMRRELQHRGGISNLHFESWLPKWFLDMPAQTEEQFEEICKAARRVLDDLEEHQSIPDYAKDSLVPLPCRLFPERVTEYPPELSVEEEDRIVAALADIGGSTDDGQEPDDPRDLYRCELSAADGTKLRGYVNWIQSPQTPWCDHGHAMEHLLTIASSEWDGGNWRRWRAVEERDLYERLWSAGDRDAESLVRPAGLMLGDVGNIYVFICCRCEGWPVKSVSQCT